MNVYRIAPTPSGFLHLGNLVNAALIQALAERDGARVLLRVDDLDSDRVRPEYVESLFSTLEFFDVGWDVGPTGPTDLRDKWSQSLRIGRYNEVLDLFRQEGQLFACTCSRSEIQSVSEDGEYPGTCMDRGLPFDAVETAWRLRDDNHPTPHAVLRQKNGLPAYMIASVVDDVDMGVTNIVRGQDLADTSAVQMRIASKVPQLESFQGVSIVHHPLILGKDGEKLSKSVLARTSEPPKWRTSDRKTVAEMVENLLGMQEQSD